mgnify:CR=1
MYSGGENLQMNGDTPHDGGHGGGGHGDCEELQRTGRSVIHCSVCCSWCDPSNVTVFSFQKIFILSTFHPWNTVSIYAG